MRIVKFDLEHFEECWLMGVGFFEESNFSGGTLHKPSVYAMFDLCRASGLSVVALDEYDNPIGMLLATAGRMWFNANIKTSNEVLWWVDSEYRNTSAGILLVEAYEKACDEHRIPNIGMCLLDTSNERLASWLERKGYKQMERSFMKESV